MADEQASGAAIEDYFVEDRVFPPPEDFKERSLVASPFLYDEADEDYQGFWAKQASELVDWFEDWHTICEWELPFAKWFVGGKLNVSHNCLDRHVAAGQGRQGRVPLGRRARRHPHHHLRRAARRGAAIRQRSEVTRRAEGRPRRHLHADDPRAARRDARLRSHRRAALGRLRRVQPGLAVRPHQRCRVQGARHGRRWVPPRRRRSPQDERRRRTRRHAVDRARRRREARRRRRRHAGRTRPLVPRPDVVARHRRRVPARADGRRGPALPALHLGHHGKAQGHHAHDRRLSHAGGVHPQVRVRPASRRRRVLVRGRHRLGHRPQLHRLRTAGQRRHLGHVRRARRTHPHATASGRSSRSTASRSSTRPPPPSART